MITDLCNWPNNSLIKLKWKFLQRKSLKSFQESLTKYCSFWYALYHSFWSNIAKDFTVFLTYIFIICRLLYSYFSKLNINVMPFANFARIIIFCCIFGIRIEKQICSRMRKKSKHFNETTGRRDAIAQREYSKRIKIVFKIRSFRIHPRSYIFKRFTYTT